MCNLDAIARMTMNGWVLIPAVPGQKQTWTKWGEVTRASYNFGELFRDQPLDCNAAILTEDTVAVVDFDAHGPEPNGLTVYNALRCRMPANTIDELTQSGGHHVYFKGVPGGTYTVQIDGVKVEILCGRKLCYCWPSRTEKGEYKIVSTVNHLNTRPEQLPELPAVFARPPPEPVRREWKVKDDGDLMIGDADAVVDGLVESYMSTSQGERHPRCQAMARALAGFSILNEYDVRRGVEQFFRHCGRQPNKGEVDGIVKYAMQHPDREPPTPWRRVMEARRSRELLAKVPGRA